MSREIADEEKRVKKSLQYSCKSSTPLKTPLLLCLSRRNAAVNSKKHTACEPSNDGQLWSARTEPPTAISAIDETHYRKQSVHAGTGRLTLICPFTNEAFKEV